jgi:hypothetical protein
VSALLPAKKKPGLIEKKLKKSESSRGGSAVRFLNS